MVSNEFLVKISDRLNDLYGKRGDAFGSIPIVMFGDLLQVLLIRSTPYC